MASTKNNDYRRLEGRIDELEGEMIQMIKDIVVGARQHLHRLIIEQKNDAIQHHDEMTRRSDLDRLIHNLEQIKKKLTEMSSTQNNAIDTHISVQDYAERIDEISELATVPINESEETKAVSNDSLKLKLTEHSSETTIDIKNGSYSLLATSDHHLLHCTLDEIRAFDINDIAQQQRIFWNKDDWIIDICYSTLLKLFFIWSNSGFYTFDSSTMEKQQTINNIPDTGAGWHRCTCFDDILLLSFDGNIEQRRIEIEAREYVLVNKWKSTNKNENGVILCMKMNEIRIVLVIGKYGTAEKLELRDHQMNIFRTLYMNVRSIALLLNTRWLIIIKSSNKLIVINNDGDTEEIIPYNHGDHVLDAITCGSNTLLIEIPNRLYFHNI